MLNFFNYGLKTATGVIAFIAIGLSHATALNDPGPRPSLKIDCSRLSAPHSSLIIHESNAETMESVLNAVQPAYGLTLYKWAPEEAVWWMKLLGSVSINSLGVAIHETNHAVNKALTKCRFGRATYLLLAVVTETELQAGDTPPYTVLKRSMPEHLKYRPFSRYQQYIESKAAVPQNEFPTLLDEFIAYVGAAELETALVISTKYRDLLPTDVTRYDGNLGGVVDFMLFTLCYAQTLREDFPQAYEKLKKQPGTMSALQNTWNAAEHVLEVSYPQTLIAGKGGKLALPADVLSTTYSDQFLTELDRLGVKHLPRSAWLQTYLRSAE